MKRSRSITAVAIIGLLYISACTNSTVSPIASIPTTTPAEAEIVPAEDNDWVTNTILDQGYPSVLSITCYSEGYNGKLINGSQMVFNKDTLWDVSIKVTANSESTGFIIEGIGSEFSNPKIFLGYTGSKWYIGYAPFQDYTLFQSLDSILGLEARLQLIISSDGKLLEVKNESDTIFSKMFDSPLFPIKSDITHWLQCGPSSTIEVPFLAIGQKENQSDYENTALSAIEYTTSLAPAVPAVSGPITVANASQLTRLVALGEGDLINLQMSPDGRFVLVGSSNGILILDSTTLEKVNFLQTTMKPEEIYIYENGTKVAALDRYHIRGHVWTFPEGKEIREVKMACNLDPTGNDQWNYSVPSKDLEYTFTYITNVAGLCHADSGEPVYILDYKVSNFGFAISPDEKYLAFSTIDKLVVVQYDDGNILTEIPAIGINGIFFTPDGTSLAAVFDNQTKYWSLADYQVIDTLIGVVSLPFFSPDQSVFASQNGDTFRLIRTADREYISSVTGTNLQFTSDSQGFIVDSSSSQVNYYEINEDRSEITLMNSVAGTGIRNGLIQSPGFLSDDKENLLVAKPEERVGDWLSELKVYDLPTGNQSIFNLEMKGGTYFEDAVWLENLNQFGVILGSPSDIYGFYTLDTTSKTLSQIIDEIPGADRSDIKFTSSSNVLVYARGEVVTLWDITNNTFGNPDQELGAYTSFFTDTDKSTSPDGRYKVILFEKENPGYRKSIFVRINGFLKEDFSGYSDLNYAFSPDSTMLAISTFSSMRGTNVSIFDLESEKRLFFSGDYFAEGEIAPKVAFSPDGKYLAILPETGYPQIWGIP